MADRAYVHYPNPVGHNAPITIGHSYGALVHVDLEEPSIWAPAWALERTPTDWTGVDLALEQIARLVRCDDGGHALVSDSRLYNARAQAEERLGQLYVMRGKEQIPVPRLHTGDIGAVTKLTHALTGDTRCDKGHPSSLPSPVFPLPLFAVAANFGLALVNVAVLWPRLQASRLSLGLGVLNAVEAVIALALAWWYLNCKDVRRLFRDRG